jgi:hypothetical protein
VVKQLDARFRHRHLHTAAVGRGGRRDRRCSRDGPSKYDDLLRGEHEFHLVTEEVIELADSYQRREILTHKFYDDGLHIALASVAEADLLVSWTFRHIVHFDKIRLFNSVNLELGYKPLQIYSPREVTKTEGD